MGVSDKQEAACVDRSEAEVRTRSRAGTSQAQDVCEKVHGGEEKAKAYAEGKGGLDDEKMMAMSVRQPTSTSQAHTLGKRCPYCSS